VCQESMFSDGLNKWCYGCGADIDPGPRSDSHKMIHERGPGPKGTVCMDCRHFGEIHRPRTAFKCLIRGWTAGTETDHGALWAACGAFESRTAD
jgi:hypothetical protein